MLHVRKSSRQAGQLKMDFSLGHFLQVFCKLGGPFSTIHTKGNCESIMTKNICHKELPNNPPITLDPKTMKNKGFEPLKMKVVGSHLPKKGN